VSCAGTARSERGISVVTSAHVDGLRSAPAAHPSFGRILRATAIAATRWPPADAATGPPVMMITVGTFLRQLQAS
jgi:hypothetical protein